MYNSVPRSRGLLLKIYGEPFIYLVRPVLEFYSLVKQELRKERTRDR